VNGAVNKQPFIVTAILPPDLAHWANTLRTAHYPPDRNYVKAHVTLFHSLPHFCGDEIRAALAQEAAGQGPVEAQLSGLALQDAGNALRLRSPEMLDVRGRLADRFHGLLTAQDMHEPQLHVTIQNKVTRQEARRLHAQLEPDIKPRKFQFLGLGLHIYRGGEWDFVRKYQFRG